MTDDDKALVERLREEADTWDEQKSHDEFDMRGLLHGAADEIERLREALALCAKHVDWMPHPHCVEVETAIRAALGETE